MQSKWYAVLTTLVGILLLLPLLGVTALGNVSEGIIAWIIAIAIIVIGVVGIAKSFK
ncbi:MAG: hypothetical protein U9Q06_01870 [Nanoarchaeota archaeon]|nr:hypothetical protein [Nanoarchaeota archaeon]